MQIVLERGTRQKQLALVLESPYFLRDLTRFVFYLVSLIDHQILPFYLLQLRFSYSHAFIARYYNIKISFGNSFKSDLSFFFGCFKF